MSFIEVDPKQTKAVIVLLAALAGAIGLFVMRTHQPASAPVAVKQATSVSEKHSPGRASENTSVDLSRNPFERPAGLLAAPAHGSKISAGSGIVTDETQSGQVAPAPVGPLPASAEAPRPFRSEKPAGPARSAKAEQSKPAFTLLATVRGAKGYSAVIRGSASVARVVEVGDMLEGGFKVKQVDSSRAVLTDGRETIVAKRPQS